MTYAIVWHYQVRTDRIEDFVAGYGPEGTWARFFRSAEGYLGTELIRCGTAASCMTIDRWVRKAQYDAFAAQNRAEYDRIDATFGHTTVEETMIGEGEFVA